MLNPAAVALFVRRHRTSSRPVQSRRPKAAQLIERLESRRLLATVAPGFATDVSYGANVTNGTALEFAPDGRLFVLTQGGTVRIIHPGGTLDPTPALTLTVDSFFERGLLGIAFDPAFDASAPGTDYVYLYYTVPSSQGGPFNRVARFEVNGNTIDLASQTEILRLNNLSAGNHNGGAIHFGPDGMLYAAVGENAVPSNAQSVGNLLGKVLRINPDPANPIPTDNPTSFPGIIGTPTGNNRAIWAVGLRNPYTFAFQPGTGRMHINDVGQSSWEEVNLGAAGANYGWPLTEGNNPPGNANVTYPLYTYPNDATTSAIVGGAFYNPPHQQFPSDVVGDYFFADLSGGWIRRLDAANNYAFQSSGGVSNGPNFLQGGSTITDMRVGPDGALYFLQRGSGNGGQGVRVIRAINPQVMNSDFQFSGVTLPNLPHRLQFQFTNNVGPSLSAGDLVLENLTTSAVIQTSDIAMDYTAAGNIATFTFPGLPNGILPDGNYRATLFAGDVTDPEGDPMAADHVFDFFFLNGDANHDGTVNLGDFNVLANNFGQSGKTFAEGDFTYDGVVNLDDFNILAGKFGTVLGSGTTAGTASPFAKAREEDRQRDQQKDEVEDLLA